MVSSACKALRQASRIKHCWRIIVPDPYLVSSLPPHEVAELHRLMTEEIKEVAVFFMNTDGIITVWNRAAEEMKGYTAEEAIGSHLALLYTHEDTARGWPQHNLQEAIKHGFYREESWRRRKDGSLFWARIALTALRNESGELVGFSKITMDLTDHKLLEGCVREREETRRVLRAANAGKWTWHPDTGQIDVCTNFLALLGYDQPGTTISLEEWIGFVHPDDRDDIKRQLDRARSTRPDTPLVTETRMRQKGGHYHWFSVRAEWYRENGESQYELSGVNVDIEDLKAAGEKLQHAVDKLQEADSRKDEFLAMLAHELRNPLAPIGAAAELLQIKKLDEALLGRTSEIITRQVRHMTHLVNDLLDVSRVTRGLVEIDRTPQEIGQIVKEAVEQVTPLIQARHHRLALDLTPEKATVLGDRKRLVQIIANLVNNAAKYTHEGGNIQVKAQAQEARVLIEVSDDGIGMAPEVASHVFELFVQAQRTSDRSSGGLGLGLPLVKSLAELHGGRVSCVSAGIGRGSRFTVELPRLPNANEPAVQQHGDTRLQNPVQALRVMVVDDNVDAAMTLAMLLESTGHRVLVEHEARRALERAPSEAPDVFLLDIGLPEMDGNELARHLRAQPETAKSILIAVTGYGQESDRNNTLAAGFDYHLVKPVDTNKLAAVLAKINIRR
jgi:PAS domain S-box-containing protein